MRIIAVSPDQPEKLRESTEKHDLRYTLLSDSGMEAAGACGLAYRMDDAMVEAYAEHGIDLVGASGETHHQLPVPAAFLVDDGGMIVFSYVNPNHKIRVSSALVLAAAKDLPGEP